MYPDDGSAGSNEAWSFGGGGGSSDSPTTPTEEEDLEDKIDDTNLDDCLKDILDRLKGLDKGVAEIVGKFAGNDPGFNWTVKDGLMLSANAQTSQHYNRTTGTVTTTFDPNKFSNASDLSAARTILHESVHAYIVAFANVYPMETNKTFPDLMLDLSRRKYNNGNDAQHAEFVRNYVNDIASSLKEYGRIRGYNLPPEFYEDLAWGGLTHWPKRDSNGNIMKDNYGNAIYEETPWFEAAFPNISDRNRVKNVIAVEQTGKDMNGNLKTKKGDNAGC